MRPSGEFLSTCRHGRHPEAFCTGEGTVLRMARVDVQLFARPARGGSIGTSRRRESGGAAFDYQASSPSTDRCSMCVVRRCIRLAVISLKQLMNSLSVRCLDS